KEVFIWCDSALKDIYCIDEKLTWADQKNDIITKLLPALCKKVDKKYNISQQELLKMLYGRWRACHREFNIRKQGDEQVERNRRRKAKNSMVKDDPYIMKYPQSDLLLNLLHNQINPVVELLCKKLPTLRRLRITSQKYIQQACFPPYGAPTWCLTNEALKKLNFPIENIPIYNSEKSNEGNNNNEDDDNNGSNDNSDTSKNTKKKNRKEKESKKRSNKKKEKKKKSKKHR
ncbi:35835_t:CDS:2, partial [Gigaspora margarita]